MNKKIIYLGLFCVGSILLTGCSTSQAKLFPVTTDMKSVWQGNRSSNKNVEYKKGSSIQMERTIESSQYLKKEAIESYTRVAENEIKNQFKRLPNPDLTIFIFPHLTESEESLPVPGYTTVIPMYSKVHYAKPGERTEAF